MTNSQHLTGVSDPTYNLTGVLYHAAQGGTVYAKYIEDAEREGDQDLADFSARSSSRTPRGSEGQGTA